jgi:hypothetical protein
MMSKLSKYDLRQISLIERKINTYLFENRKLDLCDLVSGLGGLLNALESVPDAWKDAFQTEINTLEMLHNSIEDGSISKWRGNFKEDIQKSVSNLKNMTASIMEEYLKISDPNILETAIEASPNWLICPKCNDAWESVSLNAMVICPKCECTFHNPHASITKESKNVHKDAK